jgi:glycosyltransferase involved in cell wall biosynthesis
LWIGSKGFVHKGLDLVLEAFSNLPNHHLTVCGPIDQEKAFEKAYHKELYETPNIHTYGWIDIASESFIKLANSCIGMVYPSCAEGQAGSVINCLQAGLIPIVSFESGVDVDDFGIILDNCTVDEIRETVEQVSSYPEGQLRSMSRTAWEYSINNHTQERFSKDYEDIIKTINNSQKSSHNG